MWRICVLLALLAGGCVRAGFSQQAPTSSSSSDAAADAPPAAKEAGPPSDAPKASDGAISESISPVDAPWADLAVADGPTLDTTTGLDHSVPPGTWKKVAGGSTMMGSPSSEPCRVASNEDHHKVTLTHSFAMQTTEVTQAQFQALRGYNPSFNASCASCPVERVHWSEAAAYCNALSTDQGLPTCYTCSGTGASTSCTEAAAYTGAKLYGCLGYRLPTEAEWEHAYRAGTTTAFYNGTSDLPTCYSCTSANAYAAAIAWYCVNAGGKPHPGALKAGNKLGLYDMAGNVWEWCNDRYVSKLGTTAVIDPWGGATGSMRVIRGGSYKSYPEVLRAAFRGYVTHTLRMIDVGFRCVRTAP